MTARNDFNGVLSDWLDEQAGRGAPDYLDEILSRTTRTRQRPAWSSLERLLPMQLTARFVPAPRLVWLLIIIGLLLALGAAAVFVGSLVRQPLPPPFGMAGNTTVVYGAAGGDIHRLDTATNLSRPLIVGPAFDSDPALSPDGARIAFIRREPEAAATSLIVANADGSNVRELAGTLAGVTRMVWSPDSQRLAVVAGIQGSPGLWIVGPDAQPVQVLPEQIGERFGNIREPQWRPNGHELVFLAGPQDTVSQVGLYLVQADGTGLRTIVEPASHGPARPALSPDGMRVAYSPGTMDRPALHVVDIDTGDDAAIAFDGLTADQGPHWSPDGARLLFERYAADGTYRLAVGSVVGGPVVEIGPAHPASTGGTEARFSPDGTKVLAFYKADSSSWILDPVDRSEFRLSAEIASPLTWPHAAP